MPSYLCLSTVATDFSWQCFSHLGGLIFMPVPLKYQNIILTNPGIYLINILSFTACRGNYQDNIKFPSRFSEHYQAIWTYCYFYKNLVNTNNQNNQTKPNEFLWRTAFVKEDNWARDLCCTPPPPPIVTPKHGLAHFWSFGGDPHMWRFLAICN